jgi:hypothetical protein
MYVQFPKIFLHLYFQFSDHKLDILKIEIYMDRLMLRLNCTYFCTASLYLQTTDPHPHDHHHPYQILINHVGL